MYSIYHTGNGPCPRSGCLLTPVPSGSILVAGGYSKESSKKDEEKGVTHTDMFLLTQDSELAVSAILVLLRGWICYLAS